MKKFNVNLLLILFSIFVFISQLQADVKYIILFIGDGMSIASESAASRYLYGKDSKLVWNLFPIKTFVTTWSLSTYQGKYDQNNFDAKNGYDISLAGKRPYPYYFSQEAEQYFEKIQATDSSAAASAMSTGMKIFNKNICWNNDKQIKNIGDIVGNNNKFNIGIITTTLFYDATPASFTSHNNSRNNYKQIAEEILSKTQPELIFGSSNYYYLDDFAKQNNYCVVDSININRPQTFDNIKNKKIFIKLSNYDVPTTQNEWSIPSFSYKDNNISFKNMANLSINLLLEKKKPFFLMAEQADIDHANHDNNYSKMISSVYELNIGVKAVIDLIDSKTTDMNWNNSLVIVTADHATGFLRFNELLSKGKLPTKDIILGKQTLKVDKSINYKSGGHTNELVGCYVIGAKSDLFRKYIGSKYKNTNIIDNTDIFKVLNEIISNK